MVASRLILNKQQGMEGCLPSVVGVPKLIPAFGVSFPPMAVAVYCLLARSARYVPFCFTWQQFHLCAARTAWDFWMIYWS